jgi:hypothetical protein
MFKFWPTLERLKVKLQTGSGSGTGCVPMGRGMSFGKISLTVTPKVFT